MGFYEYKILFYDEVSNKEVEEIGLVVAESYASAAAKVEDAFRDCLIDIRLYAHKIGECFALSGEYPEEIEYLKD